MASDEVTYGDNLPPGQVINRLVTLCVLTVLIHTSFQNILWKCDMRYVNKPESNCFQTRDLAIHQLLSRLSSVSFWRGATPLAAGDSLILLISAIGRLEGRALCLPNTESTFLMCLPNAES